MTATAQDLAGSDTAQARLSALTVPQKGRGKESMEPFCCIFVVGYRTERRLNYDGSSTGVLDELEPAENPVLGWTFDLDHHRKPFFAPQSFSRQRLQALLALLANHPDRNRHRKVAAVFSQR
jgi:hypothetical protein